MATVRLEKDRWEGFFDRVSRVLEGEQAEIEVAGLDLGDQLETEWVQLLGITFDPKDDLVEVALAGVDHLVRHPREIDVEEDGTLIRSILVRDDAGHEHIIRLRTPLALPKAA
ncbi:MAG: hypothetical protein D6721_03405 [Gammaproteobacteria bacterium]|nr:MAG: hypothetical protein D6721_03405 [Gammaproteobacteria bacterium]